VRATSHMTTYIVPYVVSKSANTLGTPTESHPTPGTGCWASWKFVGSERKFQMMRYEHPVTHAATVDTEDWCVPGTRVLKGSDYYVIEGVAPDGDQTQLHLSKVVRA